MPVAVGVILASLIAASGATPQAARRGDVVFQTGFEGESASAGWSATVRLDDGHEGGRAALLERRGTSEPSAMIVRNLPAERLRGCVVAGSAWVKAESVSAKPQSWNGVKFMLPIEAPSGNQWPQARIETGSFGWTLVRFAARIPPDATKVSLFLGLELVTGKAWFDDVKLFIAKPPLTALPRPAAKRHRGHSLPRLRGAMISPSSIDEAGLRTFGRDWNANLVRWQLVRLTRPGSSATPEAWDAWLQSELKRLDAMLPLCRKYGLYVALDLHSPPGGRGTAGGYAGSDSGLFTDRACQDQFVRAWEGMARRYKGVKTIWGFDLANEPVEDEWNAECDDWQALAERTAKAIHAIDPDRTIIVEPAEWGGPGALRSFVPIGEPNVVYSVHMYLPHEFTHQGVYGPSAPIAYPGEIAGRKWDKAAIRDALQPAADFQRKYNVHIYIGEFSAIRWAPDQSAYRYLRDLVEVMEELGWDWSYHAFREWDGWSVEHTEDRNSRERAATPTAREKLLREWYAGNRKPSWAAPVAR